MLPEHRAWLSGMRVTLGYISGTVRSSTLPTPTTALLSPMFQAVALRILKILYITYTENTESQ